MRYHFQDVEIVTIVAMLFDDRMDTTQSQVRRAEKENGYRCGIPKSLIHNLLLLYDLFISRPRMMFVFKSPINLMSATKKRRFTLSGVLVLVLMDLAKRSAHQNGRRGIQVSRFAHERAS
jgi:hypothetical protein